MGDSKVVERRQCPKCAALGNDKTKDNLVIYDDAHAKCFSCGYMEQPGGKKGMKKEKKTTAFENPIVEGVSLASRLISDDVCERYDVGMDSHGSIHFPYFDLFTGAMVATKSRASMQERDFRWKGEASKALLYGSHLYEKRHNAVLLCEGESDTLAAAELLEGASIGGNRILPLGISKGAGSAKGITQASLEWLLQRFDKFYIAFDNDNPGQSAVEEVLTVLPVGKAYRVSLPSEVKDIGELLLEHDNAQKLFINAVKAAQQVMPSVFASPEELVDDTLNKYYDRDNRWGVSTGYKSLDKLSGGFAPGTITVVMGGTGTGKSNFTLQLAYNAGSVSKPPLIIGLEMPTHESMMRLAAFELRDPSINYPDGTLRDRDEMHEVLSSISKCFKFYKNIGSLELNDLLGYIEVSVDAYGTELVVLDHIGFAVPDGEWKSFGVYMKALKSLAVRKGIAIIVVSHVSTKESAKEGGATQLSLTDIRASKDVIQDADTVWGLERDRASTTMLLRTLKVHRSAGGRYGEIEFDFVNGRYIELNQEEDETYDEKQLREIVQQEATTPGVRVDKGILLEGVHTGLHQSSESATVPTGEALLGDRSKRKVLAGGRGKAPSSDKAKPQPEASNSVSTTRRKSLSKKVPDVQEVVSKAQHRGLGDRRTRQNSKGRATLGSKKTGNSGGLDMKAIMSRAQTLL